MHRTFLLMTSRCLVKGPHSIGQCRRTISLLLACSYPAATPKRNSCAGNILDSTGNIREASRGGVVKECEVKELIDLYDCAA